MAYVWLSFIDYGSLFGLDKGLLPIRQKIFSAPIMPRIMDTYTHTVAYFLKLFEMSVYSIKDASTTATVRLMSHEVMSVNMFNFIGHLTVCSKAYQGWDQRNHQSSALLVLGNHQLPLDSMHKGPVMWKGYLIRSSDNDSTGLWPPDSLHTLGADGHI